MIFSRHGSARPPRLREHRFILVFMAILLVTSACGGTAKSSGDSNGGSEPQRGGVLRVTQEVAITSLDPAHGNSGRDHPVLYAIFDRLINFDPDALTAEPGLATSWSFPDPLTLELELRKDVKFTDGTPFNAEAVKFNIERGKTLQGSTVKQDLTTVSEVTVIDNYKVQLKLSVPDASLPLTLADRAGMMVSPTAVQKLGSEFERKPVGTGPHPVMEWKTDDRIILGRNDQYWQPGQPYLDGIEFIFLNEPQARVAALKSGEVDFTTAIEEIDIPTVQDAPGIKLVKNSTVAMEMMYLNLSMAPLDKVEVRQAMSYGIDREELFSAVANGTGEIAWNSVVPSTHWAYGPSKEKPYPYDPKKAKSLLKSAGYAPGEAALEFIVKPDSRGQKMAQLIQAQLEKSGFKVTLTVVDRAISANLFFGDKKGHGSLSTWTGRPDPGTSYKSLLDADSFYNAGATAPPEVAKLLAAGVATADQKERAKAYGELSDLATDQALLMPLLLALWRLI